jgi:Ribbon-helix-helix protein, copG family
MPKLVQARLDDETDRILKTLRRRTGLSDSELVRRGVRALAESSPAWGVARMVGVGRFSSGVPDLGSNKAHLAGFGRK